MTILVYLIDYLLNICLAFCCYFVQSVSWPLPAARPGPARLTCLPAAPHRVLLSATAATEVVCSVVTGGFMKEDFK